MVPEKGKQVMAVKKLQNAQKHTRRKILVKHLAQGRSLDECRWMQEGWEDGLEECIRSEEWGDVWEKWTSNRPGAVSEEMMTKFK